MKNCFKYLALCALVAVSAACGKNEMGVDTPDPVEFTRYQRYSFDIQDAETRAILGQDGVFWEEGDMVGMFVGSSNEEAEIDFDSSPKQVILRSQNAIPDGTMAFAYYPFDELNTNPSAVLMNIPNIQYGGVISSMPMAGIPFSVSSGNTNGEVYFMNLASIIDFKVYSATHTSETVQYITFRDDAAILSGDAIIDLTALDPDDEATLSLNNWGVDQFNDVTVRQNVPVAATKDAATSVYMVLAPGTYASGTITIGTDAATYTFNYSGKSLERNKIKHYNMNLDNAARQEIVVKTLPYSEEFTSDNGAFIIEGGTGYEWKFNSYGAVVSGYYKGPGESEKKNHAVNTALVSPLIDLTGVSGAMMTFEHARNSYQVDGNAAVLVKAENDLNWTPLQVDFPAKPSSGYSDFLQVEVDLSSYAGYRVMVKFEYESDGYASGTGTWEIRDFNVEEVVPVQVFSLYSGEITEGDYIIYYNGKAMKNTVNSNRLNFDEVDPTGDSFTSPDASIVWHIAQSGSYWTIYNADVNKFAASTGTKNQAGLLDSGTDDKSLWTVSGSSTYEFVNKSNSASNINANLRENTTYGFACYSTSTGGALTLYKLGFNSGSGSGSGGSGGGGEMPVSSLPGHLGCFEIPSVGTVSGHASGNEVLPENNPTLWHRWNTSNDNQKIVTHTFYNSYVSPSRSMRSYTLLQDYDKKCALWVACAMNNDVYPKAVSRSEKWAYDPALPHSWQPNLSNSYPDKDGFSYDRGHQLAASYRETTSDQVKMTCYFTNMTPQLGSLNQGVWQSTVENNIRNLGEATAGRDTLYVVSGPLFIGSYGTVEDKDNVSCARPTHYYQCFMKVSFNTSGVPTSAKGAAYLVTHSSSPTVTYTTIDNIESQSGFDFFANVPDDIENTAEGTATPLNQF